MKTIKSLLKGYTLLLKFFMLLLLAGTIIPLAHPGFAYSSVGLKQNSIVHGNTITLGDVFYNLPEGGDKILGAAPLPGHDMVLDARTLMRIAIALDLPWRPSSSADHLVLSRAGTVVDRNSIEDALHRALKDEGITDHYKLSFPDESAEIILPADSGKTVEVSAFKADPARGVFEATLVAPSKDHPLKTLRINGTLQRTTLIPVLKETLRNGTVIGQRDLDFIEMSERALNPDVVLNEEALIGMTPRRMVFSGQPVKINEIEAPRLIQRGEIVTMLFKEGGLSLSAKGKALEHGSKGDSIRVVNTSSNRTIQAVVTASGEVTVTNL